MLTRFSETIRRWAGWCPNRAAATPCEGTDRYLALRSPGTRESDAWCVEGLLVESGIIKPRILHLIALTAGLAVIIACLFVLLQTGPGPVVMVMAFAFALVVLAGDSARAEVSADREAVTIRRPFSLPLVIPKDTIVKAEVKENKLPMPYCLFAAATAVILASSARNVLIGLANMASPRIIIGLIVGITFSLLFYRTHIRRRYQEVLALTTAAGKSVVIYADDPERIAEMLGVS